MLLPVQALHALLQQCARRPSAGSTVDWREHGKQTARLLLQHMTTLQSRPTADQQAACCEAAVFAQQLVQAAKRIGGLPPHKQAAKTHLQQQLSSDLAGANAGATSAAELPQGCLQAARHLRCAVDKRLRARCWLASAPCRGARQC